MIVTETMDEIKKDFTEEELKMLQEMETRPAVLDEDCPELTEEDFRRAYRAKDGRPLHMQKENETITLNVPSWVLGKAKALGKAADASFLSRVLENAMYDPKIIEESL